MSFKKQKIRVIFNKLIKLIGKVGFVIAWTITSQNQILAFFSTMIFLVYLEQLEDMLKDCKLIDKLTDNEIMFFQTITTNTATGKEEYDFLGFAHIDDNKSYQCFVPSDVTLIKKIKDVRYIGYYKRKL